MESILGVFTSCRLWTMSSSKRPIPDLILVVEMACCSIGEVRGVVQVVQNWFTGIPYLTRSSKLG